VRRYEPNAEAAANLTDSEVNSVHATFGRTKAKKTQPTVLHLLAARSSVGEGFGARYRRELPYADSFDPQSTRAGFILSIRVAKSAQSLSYSFQATAGRPALALAYASMT
jgi:hypothetical protein